MTLIIALIAFLPIIVGPAVLLLLGSRTVAGRGESLEPETMQRRRRQFVWGLVGVIGGSALWYLGLAWYISSALSRLH